MQRLYSAILITHPRGAQQNQPHPHGIENGWIWLSNFLNLDIIPDICATLLLEFVQVAGSEMWRVYQRQFQKLIEAIHQHYVPRLDKVSGIGGWAVHIECPNGSDHLLALPENTK